MGPEFLIDTDLATGFLDNTLPSKGAELVGSIDPILSIITRIELLGWPGINQPELDKIDEFLRNADIHTLDEPIVLKTIELRRQIKMKTPDALLQLQL